MPYDEDLADRVRAELTAVPDVTEKRMFGGLALLVGGAVAVAVSGSGGLMVRRDGGGGRPLTRRPRSGTLPV